MDENRAWEIFVSTGRIEDYLNYREAKKLASGICCSDAEEVNDNSDRGSNTDRTTNKRKR